MGDRRFQQTTCGPTERGRTKFDVARGGIGPPALILIRIENDTQPFQREQNRALGGERKIVASRNFLLCDRHRLIDKRSLCPGKSMSRMTLDLRLPHDRLGLIS